MFSPASISASSVGSSRWRTSRSRSSLSCERGRLRQGLAGQRCIGLRLAHPGPRFIHRLLRLHHLRLGSPQLGAQIVGIEPPDHRARLDPVPLARPKLSQAPGDLGGNIDFRCLQAAITRGKAGGKPGRAMLVNVISPSGKHRQSEHPKDKIANAHQVHKPPN